MIDQATRDNLSNLLTNVIIVLCEPSQLSVAIWNPHRNMFYEPRVISLSNKKPIEAIAEAVKCFGNVSKFWRMPTREQMPSRLFTVEPFFDTICERIQKNRALPSYFSTAPKLDITSLTIELGLVFEAKAANDSSPTPAPAPRKKEKHGYEPDQAVDFTSKPHLWDF